MGRWRAELADFSPWWGMVEAFAEAFAEALRESGAELYLCEGFFGAHAHPFNDPEGFEDLDRGRFDAARARWEMLADSQGAAPAARSLSI